MLAASPVMAQDVDPWAKGKQWLSVRAGYARSAAAGAVQRRPATIPFADR